ncbi:Cd2+/Zn2+-exporting ATPase [Sphingobacterium allocomposti]|uniref:P-type Zn(2+) transporter n=2 Tax=Sphingobacterium allocomposti TaxID=415956 RepID=A0A5S5DEY2_9SPHI|nr:Cd2+/Zn2+-exporting ATPase [Sphingobacterium composti Yoo et al. 2007 non Ten et al. 2007]
MPIFIIMIECVPPVQGGAEQAATQERKFMEVHSNRHRSVDPHVEAGCCCSAPAPAGKHSSTSTDGKPPQRQWKQVRLFAPAILSLLLLLSGLAFDNWVPQPWFVGWTRLAWYILAYLPVGLPVLRDAGISIGKGDVFSEFFLMGIATIGAFAIGEYPEGVAVMLFYAVGETFQGLAVARAKGNIKALLDQRPDEVTVVDGDRLTSIRAEEAKIGDIIQLKPGEKLGLDGELISEHASFDTAALTGESVPDRKAKGESVLAGMINLRSVSRVKVTAAYSDSKLSRILEMVQQATSQKAPTELFIRKFAKVYTPIVVFLAISIWLLPYFIVDSYSFSDWLYRALVFLVISCPCALVISIPLGYFGGIGAASRNGILFKGSNYLDALANIRHVVMDKTGTMTEGVFEVKDVWWAEGVDADRLLDMVNVLESHSTHPVATAIRAYGGVPKNDIKLRDVEEVAGYGLQATFEDQLLLVGNFKLLDKFGVPYTLDSVETRLTTIAVAWGGKFMGHITIADRIKDDSVQAIRRLHKLGVKTTMLSGDKGAVVAHVADKLGIDSAFGDLLPEDKVDKLRDIKDRGERVAFVGDGVNDAPVVALSDVGIAMGGLGSDATIETADVVIQDDKPSRIATAIEIGRQTRRIVWQNIMLAFMVKAAVLLLGAGGLATMWEAVFADVGVALLAILNAIRIQRMRFS